MHTQNDTLEGGFGSSFLDDKETAIRLQNRLNACFADLGGSGAGEGTRTLDINLGKVALYQLSYTRIAFLRYESTA